MSDETTKEESTVTLSKNAEKILELVEGLPVLELASLVKALEEKFGVSAQAMVAAQPAPGLQAPSEPK